VFIMGNAMLRKQSYGNYPAVENIMKCVYEGLQVPMDAAIRIESRYFVKTLMTPQARAMIRSLFISLQELNKGSARPAGVPRSEAKKVSVLGAGMMGAGVAYVQAMAGIETVLIDTAQEAAEKGKSYSDGLLKKRVSRGQMDAAKAEATLARITPTTDFAAVEGSDLIIEAVFETREIKADVTSRAEARAAADAVFGSNTSTLPITGPGGGQPAARRTSSASTSSRPVDKMMLVEIIRGEKTSEETIAKAIDYVLKIKQDADRGERQPRLLHLALLLDLPDRGDGDAGRRGSRRRSSTMSGG
jgi:3-hydroxyacyl-CoA dehydrogenase/enoyl-CoA hydratase/3-hydroxybutyryl-CoA epimerase